MNVRHAIEQLTGKNYFDDTISHQSKYEKLVQELNYEACKKILLYYFSIDELKKAYKEDYYLNNLVNHSRRHSKHSFINKASDISWLWDDIGYEMVNNPQTKIRINAYCLSDLTSISKACARMVINEYKGTDCEK